MVSTVDLGLHVISHNNCFHKVHRPAIIAILLKDEQIIGVLLLGCAKIPSNCSNNPFLWSDLLIGVKCADIGSFELPKSPIEEPLFYYIATLVINGFARSLML